jgi:hypothetical protein
MAASVAFRLSGGASNADPALSIGGVMSSVAVTADTLFDVVGAAEALAGDTEYRKVFIVNDGTIDLTSVVVWINDQPAQGVLGIALDGAGKNADGDTVADESTAPTGETFDDTTDPVSNALAVPDLAVGDRHAVWLRRTISASTPGVALGSNAASLRVDYEYIP